MSDINLQLAREFFELNFFYVLPHWRFDDNSRESDYASSLLFVEQPAAVTPLELDCLLRVGEIRGLPRAVVEVRAWHADRLYPFVIESNPIFARVASQQTRTLADKVFGGKPYKIMLIVSEFPAAPARRDQAVQALHSRGIDHVMEFPTLLADMAQLVSAHGNYAPSQTLQLLRLLKRYGFLRNQQMELFFPASLPDAPVLPPVDLEPFAEENSDGEFLGKE